MTSLLDGRIAVLDSAAFVHGSDIKSLGDVFYTIQGVLDEIKDAASREHATFLRTALDIQVLEPEEDAITDVRDAAKATGDIGVLSPVDIRILALAHQLAQWKVYGAPSSRRGGESVPDLHCAAEGETSEESSSDNDPDVGWITPSAVDAGGEFDLAGPPAVVLMTGDFAVQNTALALFSAIAIMGPNASKVITSARRWVLRCHACKKVVEDMERIFCPACGSGDTLKRVSYVVGEDGTRKYFVNYSRAISTFGTIHPLRRPKGGKWRSTRKTQVLREDQLHPKLWGVRRDAKAAKAAEGQQQRSSRAAAAAPEDTSGLIGGEEWVWAPAHSMKRVTHRMPTESHFQRQKRRGNPNIRRKHP